MSKIAQPLASIQVTRTCRGEGGSTLVYGAYIAIEASEEEMGEVMDAIMDTLQSRSIPYNYTPL